MQLTTLFVGITFCSQDRIRTCKLLIVVSLYSIHLTASTIASTIPPPDYMLPPKDSNLDKQNQSLLSCR